MELYIKLVHPKARVPEYAHPGDAGMDLFAIKKAVLKPGEAGLIPTGICIQLPPNTEAQIRPRSGLALRHGVTVLNTPGTIDEGYRGEIGVILINHGKENFVVEEGMKISQMVIKSFITATPKLVTELSISERDQDGFGSTGLK